MLGEVTGTLPWLPDGALSSAAPVTNMTITTVATAATTMMMRAMFAGTRMSCPTRLVAGPRWATRTGSATSASRCRTRAQTNHATPLPTVPSGEGELHAIATTSIRIRRRRHGPIQPRARRAGLIATTHRPRQTLQPPDHGPEALPNASESALQWRRRSPPRRLSGHGHPNPHSSSFRSWSDSPFAWDQPEPVSSQTNPQLANRVRPLTRRSTAIASSGPSPTAAQVPSRGGGSHPARGSPGEIPRRTRGPARSWPRP